MGPVDDPAQQLDRALSVARAGVQLREREIGVGVRGQELCRALERRDPGLGGLVPDRVRHPEDCVGLGDLGRHRDHAGQALARLR